MSPQGALIVFVGIDGCGKGTQITMLKDALESVGLGYQTVLTKEPGGTKLGIEMRRLMFETVGSKNMAPGVYQTLGRACHIQNVAEVIEPQKAVGRIVICDRFSPICSTAYEPEHCYPNMIIMPDMIVHMWGDAEVFVGRANARTTETHQQSKAWNEVNKLTMIQHRYFTTLYQFRDHVISVRADVSTKEQIADYIRWHVFKRLRQTGYDINEEG